VPALICAVTLSAAASAADKPAASPFGPFEVKVGADLSNDYVDRGTTLSAHRPSAGVDIDVRYKSIYVRGEFNTVKLPTDPIGEFNFGGGFRHDFGKLRVDLGVEYSHYPRERLNGVPTDTDFWEASAIAIYQVMPGLEINGEYAYAPNMGKTGAWSNYTEAGFTSNFLHRFMPQGLDAEFSSGVGRYWFGNVAPEMGGYRLPAHTYWHAGITFGVETMPREWLAQRVTFDLRYHDTNLSKEDCFILAGDPNATPGGTVTAVSNPGGLRSNWCGAAVVGTLRIEFDTKH